MTRIVFPALVMAGLCLASPFTSRSEETRLAVRHWSHVILHVADVEVSLAFYKGFLGAEIFSEDVISGPDFEEMIGVVGARARIVNLVLGGQKVELIGLKGVPAGPPAERIGRGLAGFALRVDDIQEAFRRCKERGIRYETEPTEIGGFRQFAVVDPDGVRIEISQPPDGLERFGPFSGRSSVGKPGTPPPLRPASTMVPPGRAM